MAEHNNELRAQIREALEDGIVFDIYRADEAIHMYTAISDNEEFVNSNAGYANLCHAIQNACKDTLILAVARIYAQYPTLFITPTPSTVSEEYLA